jgi:hypothetical protein
MWDKGNNSTEEDAHKKMGWYEKDGFEVLCVKENGKHLVYTCKLLNKIVLEEGGQIL